MRDERWQISGLVAAAATATGMLAVNLPWATVALDAAASHGAVTSYALVVSAMLCGAAVGQVTYPHVGAALKDVRPVAVVVGTVAATVVVISSGAGGVAAATVLLTASSWWCYLPTKGALYARLDARQAVWVPTLTATGLMAAPAVAGPVVTVAGWRVLVVAAAAAGLMLLAWLPVGRRVSPTRTLAAGALTGGVRAMGPWVATSVVGGAFAEVAPGAAAAGSGRAAVGSVAAAALLAGVVTAGWAAPAAQRRPGRWVGVPLIVGTVGWVAVISGGGLMIICAATFAGSFGVSTAYLVGDVAAGRVDDGSGSALAGSSLCYFVAAAVVASMVGYALDATAVVTAAALTVAGVASAWSFTARAVAQADGRVRAGV